MKRLMYFQTLTFAEIDENYNNFMAMIIIFFHIEYIYQVCDIIFWKLFSLFSIYRFQLFKINVLKYLQLKLLEKLHYYYYRHLVV